MTKTGLLASAAALIIGGPALAAPAQDIAAPAPQAEAGQQGVLVFTPEFFADARPNTAQDMVNRIPGFSIDDGGDSRGFEGAVGNVLFNGSRPASKNDTGTNVLSRTTASQVERIELIRGGAPGIDMQGYSVVANVILKSGASRQQILTANAMLFDGGQDLYGLSYQFTENRGDRTWGVTLADGISSSDSNGAGPVTRRDASGAVLRAEDYYNDGYGGSTAIRGTYAGPALGGRVDLTARLGVSDWRSINLQTAPGVRRDSRSDDEALNTELGLVFTRPLAAGWTLESRAIHTRRDFDYVAVSNTRDGAFVAPAQRFEAEGYSSESILRGLVRREHSPSLTFEVGAEMAYNMLDTAQQFTVGGQAVPLPSDTIKVEETRGELFSKATWRPMSNLSVEGGLRLEASTIGQSGAADNEESFFYAKPRFLVSWTPMADNQLRFRFERELGQLDFDDFAASAELEDETVYGGNLDLRPEQRWISELTYERRFWEQGIVSIAYRHDRIIDAIDRIPLADGLSAVGNIGDGTLDQLAVNVVIPTARLGVPGGRFSFRNTWNKTSVTDPTSGEARRISGVRPTQANISYQQDMPSWNLQWGAAWIPLLGQPTYDPDFVSVWRGSDYLEFWAEYKPTPSLALRAQLNIWDDFEVERTVYADRTPARPIAYVETRQIDPRTFLSLRVRKTF